MSMNEAAMVVTAQRRFSATILSVYSCELSVADRLTATNHLLTSVKGIPLNMFSRRNDVGLDNDSDAVLTDLARVLIYLMSDRHGAVRATALRITRLFIHKMWDGIESLCTLLMDNDSSETVTSDDNCCLVQPPRRSHVDPNINVPSSADVACAVMFMTVLFQYRADIFISRSLESGNVRNVAERVQSCKLLQVCCRLPAVARVLPFSLVRSLIAVGECPKDDFRNACITSVRYLTIYNSPLVAAAGGLRLILSSIMDADTEDVAEALCSVLLTLFAEPKCRSFVSKDNLQYLISPFTDPLSSDEGSRLAALIMAQRAFVSLLRGWGGIFVLFARPYAVRVFLDALENRAIVPLEGDSNGLVIEIMLQTIAKSLCIDRDDWALSGQPLEERNGVYSSSNDYYYILQNYRAILLMGYIESGLIRCLVNVIANGHVNESVTKASSVLLGRVVCLAEVLLPTKISSRHFSFPKLVHLSTCYDYPGSRFCAWALSEIERARTSVRKHLPNKSDPEMRDRSLSMPASPHNSFSGHFIDEASRRRGFDWITPQLSSDVQYIKASIRDSHVLDNGGKSIKEEWVRWDWFAVDKFLDLMWDHPTWIAEIVATSRYFHVLVSFFDPALGIFPNAKMSGSLVHVVDVGRKLFSILIPSAAGSGFLIKMNIVGKIISFLHREYNQALAVSRGEAESLTALFGVGRVFHTMAHEYFSIIGRDDLSRLVLQYLNFSSSESARGLMVDAATCSSMDIRLIATERLRDAIIQGIVASPHSKFSGWGVDLLAELLYDPFAAVCDAAVDALLLAVHDERCALALATKRPPLTLLSSSDHGRAVLTRVAGTAAGIEFLLEMMWIDIETELWTPSGEESLKFLNSIETILFNSFNDLSSNPFAIALNNTPRLPFDDDGRETTKVIGPSLPSHMLGEVARTKRGCEFLELDGCRRIYDMINVLRCNWTDSYVDSRVARAAIWGLAHIAAGSQWGLDLINGVDGISLISDMAFTCPQLTIRGTAIFAMGLISGGHISAEQQVQRLGWEVGPHRGICLPRLSEHLFKYEVKVTEWDTLAVDRILRTAKDRRKSATEVMQTVPNFASALSKLENPVSQNEGVAILSKVVQDPMLAALVRSPPVVAGVYAFLEEFPLKLAVRRFVHGIFDSVVWSKRALSEI